MSLDFLYDVFLLNLTFEAAKRVFQGLSVLKSYFSQPIYTPVSDWNNETTIIAVVGSFLPIRPEVSQAQFHLIHSRDTRNEHPLGQLRARRQLDSALFGWRRLRG